MIKKIILGTVQFGLDYGINNVSGKPSAEQVFRILEYAVSRGVETLDTADAYGNASKLLGEFNKLNPGTFKINTKFKAGVEPIAQQLNKCLEVLCMNTLNTYFFHSFTEFKSFPNLLAELVTLKEKMLIKKIGVSVYNNEELEAVINTPEVDVIQFPFNLLDNRYQKDRLMKLGKANGKNMQVRSVFLQGLFFMNLENIPTKLAPLKQYLEKINFLAVKSNLSLEKLALLYVMGQPEIDEIVIGVDNLEQLHRNLNANQNSISTEIVEEINQIAVQEITLLYPKNWN